MIISLMPVPARNREEAASKALDLLREHGFAPAHVADADELGAGTFRVDIELTSPFEATAQAAATAAQQHRDPRA